MPTPRWSSIRINFFWYDASSPVERCESPVSINPRLRRSDGPRQWRVCCHLESQEDDVSLAPQPDARRTLLDRLERIFDLCEVAQQC